MLSKKEHKELEALREHYNVSMSAQSVEDDDSQLMAAIHLHLKTPNHPLQISMMVLGGFIAAAGIIAVALTFTVFNVGLMSATGLAVSVAGAMLIPIGLGLFTKRAIHYGQMLTGFSITPI